MDDPITRDAAPVQPIAVAARAAWWLGLATAALTVITFAFAITAIPNAGPHCTSDCSRYPFTDESIAQQFPGDYYWMVPAMLLMLVFIALVATVHELAPLAQRLWSRIGLVGAALASGVLLVDYFVQITVLQPSLEKGYLDGWSMLTQYNPNGVFIALEELGYLLVVLALACLVPVFAERTRIDRALRWTFLLALAASVVAFAVVSAQHGIDRQDRFEVPVISIAWLAMLVGGVLVALRGRRDAATLTQSRPRTPS
jgi:hypothetical protein